MSGQNSIVTDTQINTENQTERKNEDLSPDTVVMEDNVILKHIGKEINRIVKITNKDKKPYYFMTETLEPGSVRCYASKKISAENKEYTQFCFSLKGNKKKSLKDQENNDQDDDHVDTQKEISNTSNSQKVIDRLNEFKMGLTQRVRYRMMVPQYPEQTSYILTLKTIRLDNKIKFSNIIEFQQLKNNFGFRAVSNILMNCRYKLLFKIESITLTHSNVFIDIRLVRIFPETFDSLDMQDKLYIMNELNAITVKNITRYNTLTKFTQKHRSTKDQVRSELKKLLSI